MGWAIFIGERNDGLAATGMLVPGYGAEQQGRVRGGEGGRGGGERSACLVATPQPSPSLL